MEPASEDEREDDAKNGVLFDHLSEAEDAAAQQHSHAPDNVFPVNKPPKRRARATGPQAKKRSKPKNGKAKVVTPSSTENAGTSGLALNPTQLTSPPEPHERGNDLLDDRVIADPDEIYDENEKALSSFVKLHPMLSLDATNDRMLNKVAEMIDEASIQTKELEIVSKTHDDLFLRPAKPELGERPCANSEKCICRWVGVFRYGEDDPKAFVCREYLLPSQNAEFQANGELPRTQAKCLICTRYYTAFLYNLARNSPSFSPKQPIQIQAFENLVECPNPADDAPSHSSAIATEDGYRASVMLFVDEKWADTSSSRNSMSALLWKPTVRFNSADYEFVIDSDGTPRALQMRMGNEQQDFGGPLC